MTEEQNYTGKTRTRGYYSSALSGELLEEYEMALGVEGLDNEIALLRGMIKVMLINNVMGSFLMRAFNTLDRMTKTNRRLFKKDDRNNTEDAIQNVFEKIALKSGISLQTLMLDPFENQGQPSEA